MLKNAIEKKMKLVSFEGTHIVFAPTDDAEDNLAQKVQASLIKWTGTPWDVEIGSTTAAEPTLQEARDAAIRNHPLVKEALKVFPGAKITQVRPIGGKES